LDSVEVFPARGVVTSPHGEVNVHPHAMEVLLFLARHAGELVTRGQLMKAVWGRNPVSQETLTRNIAEIRHALGDDPHEPEFIQTVPRRGYRLIADVKPLHAELVLPGEGGIWALIQRWVGEFSRRKVFRATAFYALMSWGVLQVADIVVPVLPAPTWTMTLLVVLVAMGFPVTMLLAWVLEITEKGITLDPASRGWGNRTARHIYMLAGLVVAMLVGAVTYWVISPPFVDGRVRVAVLPLDNIGLDENAPFCAGLTEELTHILARIPELKVAARKSTEALSGGLLPVTELAQRLSVSHVLEGSCRFDNDTVRVTAQLIEADDGFHRWSQAYVVAPTSVFTIQQDIARQVARSLRLVLSSDTDRDLEVEPTSSGEAYSLYLQARGFLRKPRESQNLAQAEALFRQAAVMDPSYAAALAGLCETYLAWYELERAPNRFGQAQSACQSAVGRRGRGLDMQLALGELYRYAGDYARALEAFLRAANLDPTVADGYVGQARVLAALQRPEEAEDAFKRAIDEDPVYWVSINAYGAFLYERGRFGEAADQFAKVARLDPSNSAAFNNLGAAYFMAGDFRQAGQAYEQSLAITPKAASSANIGTMYFYAGEFDKAREFYLKALAISPEDYRYWGSLADSLESLGSQAEAVEAYGRAIQAARTQLGINAQDHKARASLAHFLARTGEAERARVEIEQAVAAAAGDMDVRYNEALVMVDLGLQEAAVAAVRAALEAGYQPALLAADPGLAPLQANAEFTRLTQRP